MRTLLRIQNKSANFNESVIPSFNLNSKETWKLCSIFETRIVKMAFFTNVVDLQAALSACLTIRDWEMLTEAVEIPENFMPLAFARLTELTVQELEVSSIMLDPFFFNFLFLNRQSCITNLPFLWQIPSDLTEDPSLISEVIPETTMMVSETFLSLLNFLLITTPTEKTNARAKRS